MDAWVFGNESLEAFAKLVREEALAQPEQEPVAWMNKHGACTTALFRDVEAGAKEEYTVPLYTTPPQRTWVGLTDDERNHIWDVIGNSDAHGDVDGWSGRDVMIAIEAKLKEKNT